MDFTQNTTHLRNLKKKYTLELISSLLESLISLRDYYTGNHPLTFKVELNVAENVYFEEVATSKEISDYFSETSSPHELGFLNYIEIWIDNANQMGLLDVDDLISIEEGNIQVKLRHFPKSKYPEELARKL